MSGVKESASTAGGNPSKHVIHRLGRPGSVTETPLLGFEDELQDENQLPPVQVLRFMVILWADPIIVHGSSYIAIP